MKNYRTIKSVILKTFVHRRLTKSIILLLAFLINAEAIEASMINFEKNIGWASFKDLSSSEFSEKFKKYSKDYILIDTEAYNAGNSLKYAMVWQKNTDNRAWAAYRNMSDIEYHKKWENFREQGYRPTDIESYNLNGNQLFSGIWVKNKEGLGWSSRRGLTANEYGKYFQAQRSKGYRVIDIEVYQTNEGIRYAAIWIHNKEQVDWAQFRDMSRNAYQKKVDEFSKKGYLLLDFESYNVGNSVKYAAIWEKRSGFGYQIRTNRTELQFSNLWREYRDKGYRLIDFERFHTNEGAKYAGIWIENAGRLRYNKKEKLDSLVKNYQTDNNLPGISVAVVKDGKMIYRRGFGHADKEAKKVAHGESVYLAASISKVIGGTIAAKQKINMNRATSLYLKDVKKSDNTSVSLPVIHQHTVGQLFAHLGCIQHYEGPEPTIQQYDKAIDALTQIWSAPFVSDCTLGSDFNYSTHAFTYLAAVMEEVSGKTSAELIQSEIAGPHGLNSIRAMHTNATLPSNYERVKPYNNDNTPTTIPNTSWKVFGGGIEASPVDLAWFGWKVLNGNIVSKSIRDDVLWNRFNSNFVRGIGWRIPTRNGKKVAEHSGSSNGTQTFLRVYRDDGLVIAIMTNRRNHSSGSLDGLTSSIANSVL